MRTGDLIKERRIALGLKQIDIAKGLGFDSSMMISHIENGEKDLPKKHIEKLAKILQISKDRLADAIILDMTDEIKNLIKRK